MSRAHAATVRSGRRLRLLDRHVILGAERRVRAQHVVVLVVPRERPVPAHGGLDGPHQARPPMLAVDSGTLHGARSCGMFAACCARREIVVFFETAMQHGGENAWLLKKVRCPKLTAHVPLCA